MTERDLLAAARSGNEDAFRRLVEPHSPGLHAHCYRLLGSLHDAEDALQDALLRAWRGLHGFDGRSGLRTWLYRITTNVCLDAIARRPSAAVCRVEPYIEGLPAPDEAHTAPEARYEQREAARLAFVAALQHLAPQQRAVIILREVLGLSAKEASESLGSTVASVNSSLQRAHKAVDERVTEATRQASVHSLRNRRVRETAQRFVDALERGDLDEVVATSVSLPRFELPSELAA